MNDLNKYSFKKYSNRSLSSEFNKSKKLNSKRNYNSPFENNNNTKKESNSSRLIK